MKKDPSVIHDEFVQAYELYADAIFRYCYFRLSDRDRAKELMSEVFTRAWDYLSRGEEVKSIRPFLYRIAHNALVDEYRRHKTDSLDAMEEEGFEPSDPDHVRMTDRAEVSNIHQLIEKLDPKYREVVILRYIHDIAVKDIANLLEEAENTVSVRLGRAIDQIKRLLHEDQI
jgi:RNA polymerase sigma-70 factor, ECF subfamily